MMRRPVILTMTGLEPDPVVDEPTQHGPHRSHHACGRTKDQDIAWRFRMLALAPCRRRKMAAVARRGNIALATRE